MKQIIERLRKEKMASIGEYQKIGKSDGLMWAKTASYDDFQYVLEWDHSVPPPKVDSFIGEELMLFITEQEKEYDDVFLNSDPNWEGWLTEKGEQYMDGWQSAVADFWAEIEDKL